MTSLNYPKTMVLFQKHDIFNLTITPLYEKQGFAPSVERSE